MGYQDGDPRSIMFPDVAYSFIITIDSQTRSIPTMLHVDLSNDIALITG